MEYNPLYDADKALKVMPSSFHDISDVEFQDNWGRFWYKSQIAFTFFKINYLSLCLTSFVIKFYNRVDLGTSDAFAIDVLLNSLTVLSSE